MNDALLTIRPNLVDLISSGKKTVELRSINLKIQPQQLIWIYSKIPKGAIEISVQARCIHRLPRSTVWSKYGTSTGLSKREFDQFSARAEILTVIELNNIRKLKKAISLSELREIKPAFQPPQLAHYLVEYDPIRIALHANLPKNRAMHLQSK